MSFVILRSSGGVRFVISGGRCVFVATFTVKHENHERIHLCDATETIKLPSSGMIAVV